MYLVKWRNRSKSMIVITGCSRYATPELAQKQVTLWETVFPFNTYYIELA